MNNEYEMQCFWKESFFDKTIRMAISQINESIKHREEMEEQSIRNHLSEIQRFKNGEPIYFSGFINKIIKDAKD